MFWNFSRALRGPRPAQGWRWRSTPEDAVALAERPLHPGAELPLDARHPARRRFHLLAPPRRGLQGAVGVLAVRQLLARRIAGRHGIDEVPRVAAQPVEHPGDVLLGDVLEDVGADDAVVGRFDRAGEGFVAGVVTEIGEAAGGERVCQ